MNNNSKFCLIPFTATSISPRGVVRACCNQMDSKMVQWENIKDIDNSIPWPTKTISILQEKMLRSAPSEEIPECNRCWSQESVGVTSYREHYQKIFFDTIDNDYTNYLKTPELKFLDIQFGYLCNLSCAMCAPSLSSSLQSTRSKMIKITESKEAQEIYKKSLNVFDNRDWTTEDHTYEKLKNLCKDITSIKISGGEPFFNPRFKDFLNYLVKKPLPIKFLHIVTNGTIYDPEIVSLLNQIENVEFRFSLEAVNDEDNFIRWPSIWLAKEQNLNRFMSELTTNKNFANICIQSLNLFSFNQTVKYIKSLPYDIEILHNVLSTTDIASLWHSDKDYVQYYLDSNIEKHPALVKHAEDVLKFKKSNPKLQATFFKDLAKVQGKNLETLFPIWFLHHQKYL